LYQHTRPKKKLGEDVRAEDVMRQPTASPPPRSTASTGRAPDRPAPASRRAPESSAAPGIPLPTASAVHGVCDPRAASRRASLSHRMKRARSERARAQWGALRLEASGHAAAAPALLAWDALAPARDTLSPARSADASDAGQTPRRWSAAAIPRSPGPA